MPAEKAIRFAMIEPLTDDRDTKKGLEELARVTLG